MKNRKLLFVSIMFVMFISIGVKAHTFLPDEVDNNTYIIGQHIFTHKDDDYANNDKYKGVLTTQHIMYASQTIWDVSLDNMIIYYKNSKGQWKNAINNSDVTPPEEGFNITVVDMKLLMPTPEINQGLPEANNPGIILTGFYGDGEELIAPDEFAIDGIEVYSRNDYDDYTLVATTTTDDPVAELISDEFASKLDVGINETVYFAIRVFVIDENNHKIYSNYSNEIVVDTTIKAPVELVQDIKNGTYEYVNCTNTTCDAKVHIEYMAINEYGNSYNIYGDPSEGYQLADGYAVFEQGKEEPVAVSDSIEESVLITGEKRVTKVYYAKAFKVGYDGNNIYGPESGQRYIDFARSLSEVKSEVKQDENNPYIYYIGVDRNEYCVSNCTDTDPSNDVLSVDYFKAYYKTGEGGYSGIGTTDYVPANEYITYNATPGLQRELLIEVYENVNGSKYSLGGMSAPYTINPPSLPKPAVELDLDSINCIEESCSLNVKLTNASAYGVNGVTLQRIDLYDATIDQSQANAYVTGSTNETPTIVRTPYITKGGEAKEYYVEVVVSINENTFASGASDTIKVRFDADGNYINE